eukprot:scaffold255466_cov29-Tisochrysis_lutea.AAC.3
MPPCARPAGVDPREVGLLRELAVDRGVLGVAPRLVEVVDLDSVRCSRTDHGERRVWTDEHCDGSAAARWARRARRIDGDVAADHQRIPPIPRARLDPRDGVEQGGGAAVARVRRRDALNIGVVTEELRLRPDLEPPHLGGKYAVPLEESRASGKKHRCDVLAVVYERERDLAEPEGVLALHSVCGLEKGLGHEALREIGLNCEDAGRVAHHEGLGEGEGEGKGWWWLRSEESEGEGGRERQGEGGERGRNPIVVRRERREKERVERERGRRRGGGERGGEVTTEEEKAPRKGEYSHREGRGESRRTEKKAREI